MLVEKYINAKGGAEDKEILAVIDRAIDSSPSLRNKKDLIERFVDSVSVGSDVDVQWREFLAARKDEELAQLITQEGLNDEEARDFIKNAFRDGMLPVTGIGVTKIMSPVSRFAKGGTHSTQKQSVIEKLTAFFDRYQGLI